MQNIGYYIGPKLRNTDFSWPLNLEDKITIYERRIRGWFLDVAARLNQLKTPDVDFVILLILMSFFEGHAMYLEGDTNTKPHGKSMQFFTKGFVTVVKSDVQFDSSISEEQKASLLESVAKMIYSEARCGLFHDGMIRHGITLYRGEKGQETQALEVHIDKDRISISFNAPKLLKIVDRYVQNYVARLRDPDSANDDLRTNFQKTWEQFYG
jgi:hypothetical protein